ncbi:MAG: hypothetical protein MUP98_21075 [Candidatus Aminicenantes bacterium]|nr:hypothetical protein [Candidatus Aminicenantes bacterium]
MNPIQYFNNRIKKFTIFDLKLAQGAALFFVLILVKIFPEIMSLHIGWFIGLSILFALRPAYVLFIKK